MEKRTFKKTGEQVSLLGFGCMRYPKLSADKNDINEQLAEEMINRAYACGVNYFDTAYSYHDGLSESFTGRALSKFPRESYKLATKMPIWLLQNEEDAPRIFAEQLKRCQVDYFDFYLVHSLNAERIETMERLRLFDYLEGERAKGRIRNLGFSFHDEPKLLNSLAALHRWDFAQIQLNYLDWDIQDAKLAYQILTENNLPVVVMEPVRGGTLANLPRPALDLLTEKRPHGSVASWALRFAADLPEVLTVLSGMSAMEQLEDNLKTLSDFEPLSEDERSILDRALVEYKKSGAIPCTGCRYCMDCPSGVDIPKNFAVYNQYKITGVKIAMEIQYCTLGKEKQADNCIECGQCVPLCPQFIDIPGELKKVAQAAAEAAAD